MDRQVQLIAMLTASLAACSAGPDLQTQAGSIEFALAGAFSPDNSVAICGFRETPAPQATCASELPSAPCPCYDFDTDGGLIATGTPTVVTGLCPSLLGPTSDWRFQYQVFSTSGCSGVQLNDGNHDLVCYDSDDLASKTHANESVEALPGGATLKNQVLCITRTALKEWAFSSCTTITLPGAPAASLRLRCGCTPDVGMPDACTCGGDGGLALSDLPPDCRFEPVTCDVICGNFGRDVDAGAFDGSIMD